MKITVYLLESEAGEPSRQREQSSSKWKICLKQCDVNKLSVSCLWVVENDTTRCFPWA